MLLLCVVRICAFLSRYIGIGSNRYYYRLLLLLCVVMLWFVGCWVLLWCVFCLEARSRIIYCHALRSRPSKPSLIFGTPVLVLYSICSFQVRVDVPCQELFLVLNKIFEKKHSSAVLYETVQYVAIFVTPVKVSINTFLYLPKKRESNACVRVASAFSSTL